MKNVDFARVNMTEMKILVVEDSEVRSAFLRDILSEFQLTFTTSSKDAINLIENESYEVILLDIDLADGLGRGLEVARRLKQTHNANSSVIVHSMNVTVAREVESLSPGAQLLPIIEMRRILARFGKQELIERLLE